MKPSLSLRNENDQEHVGQSSPPDSPRFAYHHLLALALVLFSFFMSALVSRTVFERLPHLEDEVAYLWQARVLARGQLVIDSPQPRRPFWQPFVVDYNNKRFGKYSLGWPLLLAAGEGLGQPWLINALLAGMTIALVYRLGREVFNPDTGLIAAALTAFSPMALLLNGTLMGHTGALFGVTLFLYAYWRLQWRPRAVRWGIIAGFALGLVLINRPLSAAAVAMPFILWSLVRLVRPLLLAARSSLQPNLITNHLRDRLTPLLALAAVTLLIATVLPIYNHAATGDPRFNLYTLIWSYDRIGFGEGYGQHGHTFEKAVRHTRFDLSLMAADLFGWQIGTITPELEEHLRSNSDYWPLYGVSWILLPFGIVVGLKRRSWLAALWLLAALIWVVLPFQVNVELTRDPQFAWLWLAIGAALLLLPIVFLHEAGWSSFNWTWLLMVTALAFIFVQFTYWIGSQRYSTRYYFESLSALALLSALPLAWLAKRWRRWPIYAALLAALLYSLYFYSTPRIGALYRFNRVSPVLVNQVLERRTDDRSVLVIVSGSDVRWRAFGSLMTVTSPFLDSPIVVAWDNLQPGVREQILARFPDRQVIEMQAQVNDAWFVNPP